jgi:hypothetical protein
MNDLGRTKFCLGLQLEHLHMGILVHRSTDVQKILEKSIWINPIRLELI